MKIDEMLSEQAKAAGAGCQCAWCALRDKVRRENAAEDAADRLASDTERLLRARAEWYRGRCAGLLDEGSYVASGELYADVADDLDRALDMVRAERRLRIAAEVAHKEAVAASLRQDRSAGWDA